MKQTICVVSCIALLAGCTTTRSVPDTSDIYPAFSVTASFETPLVNSIGDAADDPAIYINESGKGFIAGTDKQAGLYIYNLDGSKREFFPYGTLNNVDLRSGYSLAGAEGVLLVASNDERRNITALFYNPSTDSFTHTTDMIMPVRPSPYGICLGLVGTSFHAGVTTKAGIYYQYEISQTDGTMSHKLVREFSTNTKTEGCVFDDRTGKLYIAEEEGGLYEYYAAPGDDTQLSVISRPGDYGTTYDYEGVTLYPEGQDGGYLILSSQGNNSYAIFRLPDYGFVNRFEIKDGMVDKVTVTDGIDVTAQATQQFPEGFLVVQDNKNDQSENDDNKTQNFKIIDWRDIKSGMSK